MSLLMEELKKRSDSQDQPFSLFDLTTYTVPKIKEHLKLILQSLPEFDLHDENHSLKVVDNIEKLLGTSIISELSSYEIFMLYMSSFLHDSAMAPPEWELKVYELTEGVKNFSEEKSLISIQNDLKKPYTHTEALAFIQENKNEIYGDFNERSKWIFSPATETIFQKDLSEILVDYQSFRNRYANQIREVQKSGNKIEFQKLSTSIRYDYLRIIHHKRCVYYIKNLGRVFSQRLDGAWGMALANDLAEVCKSHGENINFIDSLNIDVSYWGSERTNLQFVSIIYRIADVMHFSHDRAPVSLRASKVFRSAESFGHWAVKEGVSYTIGNSETKQISFQAFFSKPSSYFMLHDYIDWIDNELANYIQYENKWRRLLDNERVNSYSFKIEEKVCRKNIRYDLNSFEPVPNLKFKLDQSKIINLLMGVGLYKDRFAVIRELYQNSLDSCRCMLSYFNNKQVIVEGRIEFGIESREVDGKHHHFLYCIDNGIGMNQHIIEKYLLNIGSSYYKSGDFFARQISLGDTFSPTSQFGIGILSCFMLGDRIEITTKSMVTDNNEVSEPISCSIDGPHEHFYYKKPEKQDLERIGPNGTLILVQLKDEITKELNSEIPEDYALYLHSEQFPGDKDMQERWENSIAYNILRFVHIPHGKVKVYVNGSNKRLELINQTAPFDFRNLGISEASIIKWRKFIKNRTVQEPVDYLELSRHIKFEELFIDYNGLEFRTVIGLPLPGYPYDDYKPLWKVKPIQSSTILVDGVFISPGHHDLFASKYDIRDLIKLGTLNFTGELRPQLSVDRTSLTSWPPELADIAPDLIHILVEKIIHIIRAHIDTYQLNLLSKEVKSIWNYTFRRFSDFSTELIEAISISDKVDVPMKELSTYISSDVSIKSFHEKTEFNIENFNLSILSDLSMELLMRKLIVADSINITDDKCLFSGGKVANLSSLRKTPYFSRKEMVVLADQWEGKYKEFDLVTTLWPLIPETLFNQLLKVEQHTTKISERAIIISETGNGIHGIAKQDALLVHPKLGLFSARNRSFRDKELDFSRVYDFDNKKGEFWLFETNVPTTRFDKSDRYVLMAFIAPRQLNNKEEEDLAEHIEEEVYCEGVRTGWSMLFLGDTDSKIIIEPGLKSRAELVNQILEARWNKLEDRYYFLDGTNLSEYRNSTESVVLKDKL